MTAHLLDLTTQALDEFDTKPLTVAARTALRIATMRGDAAMAARLTFEFGGGEPPVNPADDAEAGAIRSQYAAYLKDRTVPVNARLLDGETDSLQTLIADQLDDLEALAAPDPSEQALSLRTQIRRSNTRNVRQTVLATVRRIVFEYLTAVESELRLGVAGERLFNQYRARVDRMLEKVAPDVLDRLAAAIARASESGQSEHRSQALLGSA